MIIELAIYYILQNDYSYEKYTLLIDIKFKRQKEKEILNLKF